MEQELDVSVYVCATVTKKKRNLIASCISKWAHGYTSFMDSASLFPYRKSKMNRLRIKGTGLDYDPQACSAVIFPAFHFTCFHSLTFPYSILVLARWGWGSFHSNRPRIGGRGFRAEAGRERWSALDKPPSTRSLFFWLSLSLCVYS